MALHALRPLSDAVHIWVHLTPRGGTDVVDRVGEGGELRVHVRAAPVDGAANKALCRLLAAELGVARSAVSLDRGATARRKLVRIEGVAAATVSQHWPGVDLRGR